jgi:hypothetical protein
MGQYYKFIILSDDKKNDNEVIILVLKPHDFNHGAKLMEHSYINTEIMNTVEFLIGPKENFYKSRIVWAGDYADEEPDQSKNLYKIADNYETFKNYYEKEIYNYIVNHSKKLYIDKKKLKNSIHPLPLLISEGNGKGGGDYNGNNYELCGSWARDVISMEEVIPDNYNELICDFEAY